MAVEVRSYSRASGHARRQRHADARAQLGQDRRRSRARARDWHRRGSAPRPPPRCRASAMRSATPRTAASSSGRRTAPCTSMRSGTVKRSSRGTSGGDLTMLMSYWSKRLSSAISITSRKPSVAISAVLRALALDDGVGGERGAVHEHADVARTPGPPPPSALRVPSMTATSGARGVVSTLADEAALAVEQHDVGEGAADVDGQPGGPAPSRS